MKDKYGNTVKSGDKLLITKIDAFNRPRCFYLYVYGEKLFDEDQVDYSYMFKKTDLNKDMEIIKSKKEMEIGKTADYTVKKGDDNHDTAKITNKIRA